LWLLVSITAFLSYQQQLFPEPFFFNWLSVEFFAFGASTLLHDKRNFELVFGAEQQQLLRIKINLPA
jgi:hypothetical protein